MLNKYKQQVNSGSTEIILWIDTVLKNYLSKEGNEENQGEIEHILDYFSYRSEHKGKKLRLKKMGYDTAVRLSQEWVAKMNKKAANIVETEQDIEEIKKLDNGLRLVRLVGENAFKREGKLMSHCVASYYDKSNVTVYSIRDGKNMPHCTMEITDNNVNQVKGKGNGSIHPRYVGSVLKALKHIGKDVRKSEMSNLGYREISADIFTMYNKDIKDFKYITYNGGIFMYVHQKFVLKKGL